MSESEYFAPDAERVFRVKNDTHPRELGAMIAQVLFTDAHRLVLSAMGAAAVNQAVKAIAVANFHLKQAGRALCFVPQFESIEDDSAGGGDEKRVITTMRLLVEERSPPAQGEPL